jgi:hypothetical protein
MLSSNMLLLNFVLLIDATSSTPTPDFTQIPPEGEQTAQACAMAWFRELTG